MISIITCHLCGITYRELSFWLKLALKNKKIKIKTKDRITVSFVIVNPRVLNKGKISNCSRGLWKADFKLIVVLNISNVKVKLHKSNDSFKVKRQSI